jgi:hypothetical protein
MESACVKIKVAHLEGCLNIGALGCFIDNYQLVNEYGDNAFEYISTNLSIDNGKSYAAPNIN